MSEKLPPKSSAYPYHLKGRPSVEGWSPLSVQQVWNIFSDRIADATAQGARVISFVLLPDRFDLLLTTPQCQVDEIINAMLTQVSKQAKRMMRGNQGAGADPPRHLFGGHYQWRLLDHPYHFVEAYRRIYRRPVDCGLAERAENYPQSTLRLLLNGSAAPFVVHDLDHPFHTFMPVDPAARLAWINAPAATG